jgi:DNA-binding response OmpR family regulator
MNGNMQNNDENKDIKVLIIDDLTTNLEVLGSMLRIKGFQVAFATTGKQGIAIATAKLPDIIILDIAMPEMDGFTVCTELKKNPLTKSIPVIFLSAKREVEDIKKGILVGGADYIAKPFNSDDVVTRVKIQVSKRREQEQNIGLSLPQIKEMEEELVKKWRDVKVGMFVDDILEFADDVFKFGKKNNISTLAKYAEDLTKFSQGFKVDKLEEEFNKFPDYVKMLVTKK